MTNPPANEAPRQRAEGLRGHIAGIVALVALAVVVVAWWWTTRQPVQEAGYGLPHGVLVAAVCTFFLALMAEIRAMSFLDVLEFLWEMVLGALWLVGAILKGIWNFICGLFGY